MNEHYQAVLADLEQMKKEAEDGIRAIKRLMSRGSVVDVSIAVGDAIQLRDGQAASVPQRVLAFLGEHPGKSFSTEEIAEGISLGPDQLHTLRGALGRLYNKGKKIGKYGRGRYRARRANESEPPA